MRVIVVGSGIAGLVAAIRAARVHEVLLVTKGSLEEGSTRHAQGGIAAVLTDDDSVEAHIADTLAAGAGLCDPEAVRVLCEEGPERVRDLIAFGVDFDRDPSGAPARGLEAAHSAPRILHAGGDATGAAIEAALVAAVRATAVRIVEHAMLVDLVLGGPEHPLPATLPGTQDPRRADPPIRSPRRAHADELPEFPAVAPGAHRVAGVELLVDGVRRIERADAVILATGGAGQLYPHTTNPPVATGDGIAAAWRAGAEVADLEFVQFHPTALADGFLVSEAVRGEGAVLRDADGRRYMPAVDPSAELAPRDVVARATARVMARQHGAPALLDATALPLDLAKRFPSIHAHLRGIGVDWTRTPVPVTPAAHYTMGGVATDLHGRTSLPGLLAVGEVARTGVHGANRLASNSLLESLVFAWRAAKSLGPAAAPPRETQDRRATEGLETAAKRDRGVHAPEFPIEPGSTAALAPSAPLAPSAQPAPLAQAAPPAPSGTQDASGCAPAVATHPLVPVSEHPNFPTATATATATATSTSTSTAARPRTPATRADVQTLAWRDLGLTRDGAALAAALTTLDGWRIEGSTVHDLENRNLLDLARLVAEAALARTASVGAHHRGDADAASAASA